MQLQQKYVNTFTSQKTQNHLNSDGNFNQMLSSVKA